MATIFCLAHFCETHGPTPLMATEALPVDCTTCSDEIHYFNPRRASIASRIQNEDYPTPKTSSRTDSSSSTDLEKGSYRTSYGTSSAIVDTPPESPRLQTAPFPLIRDSSFRKTYTDDDKARASPCDNCALTLPPQTNEQVAQNKLDNNGPILRTRKAVARVRTIQHRSPPQSTSSSSASEAEETEDSETELSSRPQTATQEQPSPTQHLKRVGTSSTSSTSSTQSQKSHEHFLDYTSSHEPLLSKSFSVMRQSCLRTLSMETLPPTTAPTSSAPFLTLNNSTSSGGPIFFGDKEAGWTIAYKFRISDPTARGRRRQYAFIMHSMLSQRSAMSFFTQIGTKFQELAMGIQHAAEAQLGESESSLHSPRLGAIDESRSHSSLSMQGEPRRGSDGTTSSSTASMRSSAFMSGRSRGSFNSLYNNGGMMGAPGAGPKGKGLAELVGQQDIFFKLHCEFVGLLMGIGMAVGA